MENLIGLNFRVDIFSLFVAFVSTAIGMLIIVYSLGYMKEYSRKFEYYFYVLLFIISMILLVFSDNLLLMYIFWEITAVCSWQLIGFNRGSKHLSASNKAFLITSLGSLFMLVGFSLVYLEYGSLNMKFLSGKGISIFIAILIFCGMVSKSAQLPLHSWLADAGVAPTPVTALLHAAVLVKIGVYAFARIFLFTFLTQKVFFQFVMVLSGLTIIFSGASAFIENDIKKILANSTISQIGYIFLGFASGVYQGILGAIFFILAHGIAKAGLFLVAGIVEHNTHERDIRKLGGIFKTMPISAVSFFVCALSIIGFPPFGGFFAKFLVLAGVVQTGNILISALAVFGAILTLMYLFRLFNYVFLGQVKVSVKEKTMSMVIVILLLAFFSILNGILINPITNIFKSGFTYLIKEWKLY